MIEPIFFVVKDIHDIITHAKLGDNRLRGSGVVAGQISTFPIDFAGRPYNTLTLPCKRVITVLLPVGVIKDEDMNRIITCQHIATRRCFPKF